MIKVECSNCHNHFFTPPKAAGKSGKCPSCGELIIVPIPGEPLNGTDLDAPNGPPVPRNNRQPASHPGYTSPANHPTDDRNGASSKPEEVEKGFKEKTMEWLKDIFELEE